jgi:anti-sigma factor RsiW
MFSMEGQEHECSNPPGVSGNALIAAVDGEATPETLTHLCECPHCAARVERIRSLQRRLRHKLYRLHCPATLVLVDYCQGLLNQQSHAQITHHLALCPHCAAEVALLSDVEPINDMPLYNGLRARGAMRPLL